MNPSLGSKINVSFLSLNRKKRSLAIDLKKSQDKPVLLDLVRNTDVFLAKYCARPAIVTTESMRRSTPALSARRERD